MRQTKHNQLLSIITYWLTPPRNNNDKNIDLFLRAGFYIVWVGMLICIPLTIYFARQLYFPSMFATGGGVISNSIAIYLIKQNKLQAAFMLATSVTYIGLLIGILFNTGIDDIGIQAIYPLFIVNGILLGLIAIRFYTAITIVWMAALIYLDSVGFYLDRGIAYSPIFKGAVTAATFILSVITLRYFVQTTITANERLSDARIAADQANTLKSHFLTTMSHELRTPLNAIIGYSEDILDLATEQEAFDRDIEADVDKISQSGRHLLRLINDILDLAKIDAGQMNVSPQMVDVKREVEKAIDRLNPLFEKNRNQVLYDPSNTAEHLLTDQDKLGQILFNLLSNAAKYTQDGTIELSCQKQPTNGSVLFVIKDTGIGIEPEKLPHIFDAFRQIDNSFSRSFEGTGLGLALTKELVSLLKGDLMVESEHGTGTTFTISLPNLPLSKI